MMYSKERR